MTKVTDNLEEAILSTDKRFLFYVAGAPINTYLLDLKSGASKALPLYET